MTVPAGGNVSGEIRQTFPAGIELDGGLRRLDLEARVKLAEVVKRDEKGGRGRDLRLLHLKGDRELSVKHGVPEQPPLAHGRHVEAVERRQVIAADRRIRLPPVIEIGSAGP